MPSVEQLLKYRTAGYQSLESSLTLKGWRFISSKSDTSITGAQSTVTFAYGAKGKSAKYWLAHSNTNDVIRILYLELFSADERNDLLNQAKKLGFKFEKTKLENNRLTQVYRRGRESVIEFTNRSSESPSGFDNSFYIIFYDAFDYDIALHG